MTTPRRYTIVINTSEDLKSSTLPLENPPRFTPVSLGATALGAALATASRNITLSPYLPPTEEIEGGLSGLQVIDLLKESK